MYPITVSTNFDSGKYWANFWKANANTSHPSELGWVGTTNKIRSGLNPWPAYGNKVNPRPVYTFLGVSAGNMTEPAGIRDRLVHQSSRSDAKAAAEKVVAVLDVFVPKVSCEAAKTKVLPSNTIADIDAPNGNWCSDSDPRCQDFEYWLSPTVQIQSDSCSVGFEDQAEIPFAIDFNRTGQRRQDNCDGNVTCARLFYDVVMANCSNIEPYPFNSDDLGNRFLETRIDASTPYDFRYAIMVSNETYAHGEANVSISEDFIAGSRVRTIHDVVAVVCKVDYTIAKAPVTWFPANDSFSIGEIYVSAARHISNLTGTMLGELVRGAQHMASGASTLPARSGYQVRGRPLNDTCQPSSVNWVDSFFDSMLQTLHEDKLMDRFLSIDTLRQSAIDSLSGIAAHVVHQNFVVHDDTPMQASGTYIEYRIRVRTMSLWIMVVGLLVIITCTLCIILAVPQPALLHDPSCIATYAMILCRSDAFRSLLGEAGVLRTSQLSGLLRGLSFYTLRDQQSKILTQWQTTAVAPRIRRARPGVWRPLSVRYPILIVTITTPLIAVIALGILGRLSDARDGITDVSVAPDELLSLARYISATVMLLIATCYNSLDFTVSSFAPLSLLRMGPVAARQSISYNLIGKLPPIALWQSLKGSHFASIFSIACAILGSVLTIVASGLWRVNFAVLHHEAMTATYADSWDFLWPNSSRSGDGGAFSAFDAVHKGRASMPNNIWNNTVVTPGVKEIRSLTAGGAQSAASSSQNITLQVDALRPILECEAIQDQFTTFRHAGNDGNELQIYFDAAPPLAPGCRLGEPNGTRGCDGGERCGYNVTTSLTFSFNEPESIVGVLDLHLYQDPWQDNFIEDYGSYSDSLRNLPDNPAGCPSILVRATRFDGQEIVDDDHTALLCSQKLQQLAVNVTYQGGNTTKPTMVVIDEDSAVFMDNGTEGFNAFPWRYQFMWPMRYYVDVASLSGKENIDKLEGSVKDIWAQYMFFVIDKKFRRPTNQSLPVQGIMTTQTARLKMDHPSKTALQIILSIMARGGICAFWLTDLRGTVPRHPYSIASMMGFLAGSELCNNKDLIQMSEDADTKDLEKVFEGMVFSIGWWDVTKQENEGPLGVVEGTNQRRFGIDIGRADQLGFRETTGWTLRRRMRVWNRE